MRHRIVIFHVALLLSMPCRSAEFFYLDHDSVTDEYTGPVGPLVLSGEITAGDYDALLTKILGDENRFLAQNKITLASDGGDVAEALKIAQLVKSLHSRLSVGALTGRCVSACFYIYAAAAEREVDGEKLLGINRPFIAGTETAPAAASAADSRALTQVHAFLLDNAVPNYLVDEMFRHASDDAYWLSADDQKNLGSRSQSFKHFLAAKCAWDERLEHEVYAGKRPLKVLKRQLKCKEGATRRAAHEALLAAGRRRARLPDTPAH
jgi:ATP-dependent protease ClpP protease subunit